MEWNQVSRWALLALFATSPVQADYLVHQRKTGDTTRIISVDRSESALVRREGKTVLRSFRTQLAEDLLADSVGSSSVDERILYTDEAAPSEVRSFQRPLATPIAGSEVRVLVQQGPKENRINLTMVGDGYTSAEKEKFFQDMTRLKDELFRGHAYASYLPLFNVVAVFVPSQDSGITDGTRKRTALGLFRSPPGSKRAIMPGNTQAIDAAVALAPATDYPIVIANDDFYGGLGGEYAISTRSVESGIIVLRHELGHNFGQVGEEYDGGQVYQGANFSATSDVPWKTWNTPGSRVNEGQFLNGSYAWKALDTGAFTTDFDFPAPVSGGAFKFEILLSGVGWELPGDVTVLMDGSELPYVGGYTADRGFFDVQVNQSPAPGTHHLEIRRNRATSHPVLAFAEVYAYPPGYDFDPSAVGAYAVFDGPHSQQGYRPTHDSCPMRNMSAQEFCVADKENFWHRFLKKVDLIDSLALPVRPGTTVKLATPPLPDLEMHWYRLAAGGAETEITAASGQSSWLPSAQDHGSFRVKVDFKTSEARTDDPRFHAFKDFTL